MDYHITREDKERLAKGLMDYKRTLIFLWDEEYATAEVGEIDELAKRLELGGYNNDYYQPGPIKP